MANFFRVKLSSKIINYIMGHFAGRFVHCKYAVDTAEFIGVDFVDFVFCNSHKLLVLSKNNFLILFLRETIYYKTKSILLIMIFYILLFHFKLPSLYSKYPSSAKIIIG